MKSTDFVERIRSNSLDPPVRSLMDIDFYKFTMGQLIYNRYRDVEVVLELIVRDKDIPVAEIVREDELRAALDFVMGLSLTRTDIAYLRGMDVWGKNMFSEEYLTYLRMFRFPPYTLSRTGSSYRLRFRGRWGEVSMWETLALAIISELYYRSLMRTMPKYEIDILYARAKDRIYSKLLKLKKYPGIRFADFGQRRRHSFLWQEWVIGLCKDVMGSQFVGTSNTWMAFKHDLTPIGTNAHELPMVLTALQDSDSRKKMAQYAVLNDWENLYGEGLRIMLPDTFGTEQFLAGAGEATARDWRGMRQDSGDPISRGELYISWLGKHGVNPKEKNIIFSDGLDDDPMIWLYNHFRDHIQTSFGWGTLLTNDFRDCCDEPLFRPFSIVCKVVEANGRPAVKLSDNLNKATGPKEEVERYQRIFGSVGQTQDRVLV